MKITPKMHAQAKLICHAAETGAEVEESEDGKKWNEPASNCITLFAVVPMHYRIKPAEPRMVWVNFWDPSRVYGRNVVFAYESEALARENGEGAIRIAVPMKEVIAP